MAWTKWLFRVEESLDKVYTRISTGVGLSLYRNGGKEDERECRIIFIAAVFIGDENNIMKETNSV